MLEVIPVRVFGKKSEGTACIVFSEPVVEFNDASNTCLTQYFRPAPSPCLEKSSLYVFVDPSNTSNKLRSRSSLVVAASRSACAVPDVGMVVASASCAQTCVLIFSDVNASVPGVQLKNAFPTSRVSPRAVPFPPPLVTVAIRVLPAV